MGLSKSSKKWLNRQRKDPYVLAAKKQGLRSRAAFKIRQIQERYNIVQPGMHILELGAAPGGWTTELSQWVGSNGQVVAIDRLPMSAPANVEVIEDDIESETMQAWLQTKQRCFDIVLSDMSPNMCGHKKTDQLRASGLCEFTLAIAEDVLVEQGALVMKAFQGLGFTELQQQLRDCFTTVTMVKPDASQRSATEIYILARGHQAKITQDDELTG